ncbi:MAG: hypothetical protein C0P77_016470 [Thermoanaerobacterales bacterium]|jgi:hypothetical protein|nr:hypothetical protein [Thermoanaerobacterales bacterium]
MSDENPPARGTGHDHDPFDGTCPLRWMVEDIGRYLAGDDAPPEEVDAAGHRAISRAVDEARELLQSAYRAHDVVATELRFAGPVRGFRRTVFALPPTPAALMLLCARMCDVGDDVQVMQHTAACGTATRSASWPFGMAVAERLTRPPARDDVPVPAGLDDLDDAGG